MHSNQLPVSGGVAIFIAVIISYFVYSPEDLSGVRPNDSKAIEQVHGDQDVQARLWQDPFAAVAIHKQANEKNSVQIRMTGEVVIPPLNKKTPTIAKFDMNPSKASDIKTMSGTGVHSFKNLIKQIANEFDEYRNPVNVLSVMVSAGPYPENEELRLRRRYAVIAGLAASGYQPEDSAHIGYVEKLSKAEACGDKHPDDKLLPAIMPYEWFKNAEDESYFLLLWLDEDAFARKPLCKLNFLIGEMDEDKAVIREFKVIGPSSSGTLKAMTKELEKEKLPNLKNHVLIYSAMATAQDSALTMDDDLGKNNGGLSSVEKAFKAHDISLFRTIANDGDLAAVLLRELTERMFDATNAAKQENFQIALVSEWDTLYGRSLPDAFVEQAQKQQLERFGNISNSWEQTHIYRFSYLRGIDGRITGESRKEKSSAQGLQQGAEKNAAIDRPEGRSQRDYLRRLAGDMQLKDRQLKNEGKKGIRAIGILGSDVYDKLMVLRVLRQRFPKAIFFTTDLDASLLHPGEFQWTRNMLVASSYDLKIADQSELKRIIEKGGTEGVSKVAASAILMHATKGAIPRFRDAYQTSVYLSTLWATNKELSENNTKNKDLFEHSFQLAKAKEEVKKAKIQAANTKKMAVQTYKDAVAKAQTAVKAAKDAVVMVAKAAVAKTKQAGNAKQAEQDKRTEVIKDKEAFRSVETTVNTKSSPHDQVTKLKDAQARLLQEKRWILFKALFKANLHPRVYEIGRNGAVELTRKGTRTWKAMFAMENTRDISPFYPTKPALVSPHNIIIVAACLMVFALLAFAFWCRWIITSDENDMDAGLYKTEINKARCMTGAILSVLCFFQFVWTPSLMIIGGLVFIGYILFTATYCCWIKNIMTKKVMVMAAITIEVAIKAVIAAIVAEVARVESDTKVEAAIKAVTNTKVVDEIKIEATKKAATEARKIARNFKADAEAKIEEAKKAALMARDATAAKAGLNGIPNRLQDAVDGYLGKRSI